MVFGIETEYTKRLKRQISKSTQVELKLEKCNCPSVVSRYLNRSRQFSSMMTRLQLHSATFQTLTLENKEIDILEKANNMILSSDEKTLCNKTLPDLITWFEYLIINCD